MKIVFATNNAHKLSEIKSILGGSIEIVSLSDIGCTVDIPETGKTLEENAHIKAAYVFEHYGLSCFADDTGLEVEAFTAHVMQAERGTTARPTCANCLANWPASPTATPDFAPSSRCCKSTRTTPKSPSSISSKASSQATLPPRNTGKRASVTTPSSSPTAMIRALPSWEKPLKTKSVIVHAPSNSWLFS